MSASRKRLRGKGVEAFFSRSYEKRGARFYVGLSAIVGGCALWFILVLHAYFKPFGAPIINSYTSLLAPSLGLVLMISGIGVSLSPSTDYPSIDQEIEKEKLVKNSVLPNGTPTSEAPKQVKSQVGILSDSGTKYCLTVFIQSCVAIALYSGLVDEYQSNISMQRWIQAIFPVGRYLLDWEAVLFTSAVLGLLITQFLPGRALAD